MGKSKTNVYPFFPKELYPSFLPRNLITDTNEKQLFLIKISNICLMAKYDFFSGITS